MVKDGAYSTFVTVHKLCSPHLEILGFPMGGTYDRDIFAWSKTMQRKHNLVSALGIHKENWG